MKTDRDQPLILFLSGSINSGKSTVGKIVAKRLPKCAFIEVDSLREMIGWMPLAEAIPLNLENSIAIARNFVKAGLSAVISYPLSQENHDYIVSSLKGFDIDILTFTLAPSLQIALANRGGRELTEAERDRIRYHYSTGISNPKFGDIIDNSDQTPEETARIILDKIETFPGNR